MSNREIKNIINKLNKIKYSDVIKRNVDNQSIENNKKQDKRKYNLSKTPNFQKYMNIYFKYSKYNKDDFKNKLFEIYFKIIYSTELSLLNNLAGYMVLDLEFDKKYNLKKNDIYKRIPRRVLDKKIYEMFKNYLNDLDDDLKKMLFITFINKTLPMDLAKIPFVIYILKKYDKTNELNKIQIFLINEISDDLLEYFKKIFDEILKKYNIDIYKLSDDLLVVERKNNTILQKLKRYLYSDEQY